jgi:hypothetical protein
MGSIPIILASNAKTMPSPANRKAESSKFTIQSFLSESSNVKAQSVLKIQIKPFEIPEMGNQRGNSVFRGSGYS